MTTLHIRFDGRPYQYDAIPWTTATHGHPFRPIPDATSLVVAVNRKRCLFVNGQGGRRPETLTLEEARTWRYSDNGTEMIYAQALTATSRLCLRLVFYADKVIRDTSSNNFRALNRLVEDAKFHSTHLTRAEGRVVPIHYGLWAIDTGDWAGKILFSLTQWGGIPWTELLYSINTEENRILIGRTFESLHDYGVVHGNPHNIADLRHVLIDVNAPGPLTTEDLLAGKAPCYIVGFSEALARHRCKRTLPIIPLGSYLPKTDVRCEEVDSILLLLDFMMPDNLDVPTASQALEWHDKYSKMYPDQSNMAVMIAQRAMLYPNVPPVYPLIRVSFGEGEFPKAIISKTTSKKFTESEKGSDSSNTDLPAPGPIRSIPAPTS
ncbi:hypothetical protein DFH06DRAFT_1237902 [Mycena polygramma]|nr:hypothetical protein DFH06DRAFT_1237902 [Mycena polygramma]